MPSRGDRPLPRLPLRRWRHTALIGALFAILAALVALRRASTTARGTALATAAVSSPGDGGQEPMSSGPVGHVLGYVHSAIQPLQKQVESGHIVAKYGEKAQSIVAAVVSGMGEAGPEIERAVDGMLQALFLQQLSLLRQQLVVKFEKASKPAQAASQADSQFVTQAQELVRPGSDWSFDQERYALRATLEGTYRRDAAIAEEKVLSAQTQQSTVEIISKLQSQMEALQTRVQALRAGSPWFLSSSYRIPGTPLQLIGRYQQGRANLELSLNPDRDPANSEAGFVDGIGPANLGVTLNVGV
mmetsp:Transcript_147916/g.368582  ORF Transcript_147916/g.368582 Transcript_147916/m.368582 type:complete len:301 (-) Transcript_147916:97-999(-)